MDKTSPLGLNMSLNDILRFELSFSIVRYYYNNFEKGIDDWYESLTKAVIYSRINGWSLDILEDVMENRTNNTKDKS